jgi:hypothetical protein
MMVDHGITDYRKILIAYMTAVLWAEGVTFVRDMPSKALTSEEWAALYQIETDVKEANPNA